MYEKRHFENSRFSIPAGTSIYYVSGQSKYRCPHYETKFGVWNGKLAVTGVNSATTSTDWAH